MSGRMTCAGVQLDTMSREERRVPIVLGGFNCEGGEDSLLSCPGSVLGEGSRRCGIAEAVAVICYNELDPGAVLPLVEKDGRHQAEILDAWACTLLCV